MNFGLVLLLVGFAAFGNCASIVGHGTDVLGHVVPVKCTVNCEPTGPSVGPVVPNPLIRALYGTGSLKSADAEDAGDKGVGAASSTAEASSDATASTGVPLYYGGLGPYGHHGAWGDIYGQWGPWNYGQWGDWNQRHLDDGKDGHWGDWGQRYWGDWNHGPWGNWNHGLWGDWNNGHWGDRNHGLWSGWNNGHWGDGVNGHWGDGTHGLWGDWNNGHWGDGVNSHWGDGTHGLWGDWNNGHWGDGVNAHWGDGTHGLWGDWNNGHWGDGVNAHWGDWTHGLWGDWNNGHWGDGANAHWGDWNHGLWGDWNNGKSGDGQVDNGKHGQLADWNLGHLGDGTYGHWGDWNHGPWGAWNHGLWGDSDPKHWGNWNYGRWGDWNHRYWGDWDNGHWGWKDGSLGHHPAEGYLAQGTHWHGGYATGPVDIHGDGGSYTGSEDDRSPIAGGKVSQSVDGNAKWYGPHPGANVHTPIGAHGSHSAWQHYGNYPWGYRGYHGVGAVATSGEEDEEKNRPIFPNGHLANFHGYPWGAHKAFAAGWHHSLPTYTIGDVKDLKLDDCPEGDHFPHFAFDKSVNPIEAEAVPVAEAASEAS